MTTLLVCNDMESNGSVQECICKSILSIPLFVCNVNVNVNHEFI